MQAHQESKNNDWDLIIKPKGKGSAFDLRELLRYKDLLLLFVKRDFISLYKQTVLGPIWVVIQPILTTITFFIVFTKIAAIGTMNAEPILFYMCGITVWTYFADCVVKTSDTFIINQNIFGKVYFPRLIVPLSIILTNLIKFGIQFFLFLAIYFFYMSTSGLQADPNGISISPSWQVALIPFLLLIMAMLGLGVGLIISALTTKYRDLRFLIQFGIQLAMYATPVVWPLKLINQEHHWKLILNPMASIVETFKAAFFGTEAAVFNWMHLAYSAGFALLVLIIGVRLFSRIEKSFMDTI